MKIAVMGTHGVGKTTLCYDIAAAIKKQGKSVDVVKEIARSCPLPVNKETTKRAQSWVLHAQIAKEIEAEHTHEVVVCDRSVLDNYAYLVHKMGKDDVLDSLVTEWMKTYDFVFKVPVVGELQPDNFRDVDEEWQRAIDLLIDKLAQEHGVTFIRLSTEKAQWPTEIMRAIGKTIGKTITL